MYLNTHNKSECCGCRSCEQVCSTNAISLFLDQEGFSYPEINQDLCVNCGLCEKVCPISNVIANKYEKQTVYAAWNKNEDILKLSSSGGVFSVIAEEVLSNMGVVYGAAFDKNMILSQHRVDNCDDLKILRGSKYLQSDTKDSFMQVKNDLNKGIYVYYTGTPCQIAGLKLFLNKDYDNLITSDLICHGVPSQKIFSTCIRNLEKKRKGKVIDYLFRDKKIAGWSCSSSSYINKAGKIKYVKYDYNMEAYFNCFLYGHISRICCYSCPFARVERVGDITLADYWGIKKHHPEVNTKNGISLVLLNSPKGEATWNKCKSQVNFICSEIEYAFEKNYNLEHPTNFVEARNYSYQLAFADYNVFMKHYLHKHRILHKQIFYIKSYIRKSTWLYNKSKLIRTLLTK